jgi:hypothetical protein
MARFPFQYININGVPTLEVRRITVTDTAVDFTFRPDFDGTPFRGLLLVYVPEVIPEGTTTTLPIRFVMAGNTSPLTSAGSEAVTVADFAGTGVYLVYYDRFANILQLV